MTRAKADIFKENGKSEIFVIGDTDEERAQLLYIRGGLIPRQIKHRLKNHSGVDIPLNTIKNWMREGKWAQLRKDFEISYDSQLAKNHAENQANNDMHSQEEVRSVYATLAANAMNIIKQKFDFSKPKYADASIVDSKDMLMLSQAMKNFSDIHFRALGIPEVAIVDPTMGNDQISIMTKQDMDRLEKRNEE